MNKKLTLLIGCGAAFAVAAAEESNSGSLVAVEAVQTNLNVVWTLVAGILVFAMQAGFALVEAGLTRAKNTSNIMMKNIMDFVIGSICFWVIGAAFMFGATKFGFIGTSGFFMDIFKGGDDWNWTYMFFQTMFCATAATIVSGAMAERTQFRSYLVYSALISLFIYPIAGKWAWGGGWLANLNFHDFAGSTVVHSVGGWLALAGAIALGPRLGKYGPDGKPRAIPGHSIALATTGVLVLWIGWFGFNPGSTVAGCGDIGRVAMITNFGAVAGTFTALFTAWIILKKSDPSMTLNGALAGLVAITAPCDIVTPVGALCIGGIAGILVVLSVLFIDRLGIDDPVGAISVHLVNGVWGTLACGFFGAEAVLKTADTSSGIFYGGGIHALAVQSLGVLTYGSWAFILGGITFVVIKKTIGLRVSADEERKGLDMAEHGTDAYAGFQFFMNE
ncbi:MAG: ammonium transporter [Lentisphaeria bacterium]|nr:ammonium transporter [Lentisphaeria bacterium]